MKLLMVITDGFEEVEAIGTIGILRRARLDVTLACLGKTQATGRYGVTVSDLPNLYSLNADDFDMLIIPGGPEYLAEEKDSRFLTLVQAFASRGKNIAAICAGPTILGHLGLLKGKTYTCFTSMNEDFGGTLKDLPVVKDGSLITGRSASASIDFAFAIIEMLMGKTYADQVKASIYYK
jgi:protein deglycase